MNYLPGSGGRKAASECGGGEHGGPGGRYHDHHIMFSKMLTTILKAWFKPDNWRQRMASSANTRFYKEAF